MSISSFAARSPTSAWRWPSDALDSSAAEDPTWIGMLRIGDFARLGGVTVRALRHYEDEGLLAPAHVDEVTGYRSYQFEQLAALDRILALRDLGFSLADVGALLASNA